MLHKTINGFLRQIIEDHDKHEDHTSAGEIGFLNDTQARIQKIIEYANGYAELEATQAKLKALESAIQPEPAPKPPPEKPKPIEYPEYTDTEHSLIAEPMTKWSDRKRSAAITLSDIHPDSILEDGEVEDNYWTWDEIKHLTANGPDMDADALKKAFPEHNLDSITKKAASLKLDIKLKKPTGKAPAKSITPNIPTNPVEAHLPDEIRNPPLPVRLRIFRLFSNLTIKQVARTTGINKDDISDYERGKATPDNKVLTKLANTYNMTVQSIISRPIGEIIPFTENQTIETRTRIARIRTGMSIETLAAKLFEQPATTRQYEARFQGETSVRRIADILGIPAWVILTAKPETAATQPEPDKTPAEPMTTGAKIRKTRYAKGISANLIAERTGIQTSTLYRIERGEHIPQEDTLQAIASALGTPVHELTGDDPPQQPTSVIKEVNQRKKAEKKPEPKLTPTPVDIPSSVEQSLQEAITEARLNRNLTQKELSNKSGVPLNHVKDLEAIGETGTNGYMMRKLCKYLDIDPNKFIAH